MPISGTAWPALSPPWMAKYGSTVSRPNGETMATTASTLSSATSCLASESAVVLLVASSRTWYCTRQPWIPPWALASWKKALAAFFASGNWKNPESETMLPTVMTPPGKGQTVGATALGTLGGRAGAAAPGAPTVPPREMTGGAAPPEAGCEEVPDVPAVPEVPVEVPGSVAGSGVASPLVAGSCTAAAVLWSWVVRAWYSPAPNPTVSTMARTAAVMNSFSIRVSSIPSSLLAPSPTTNLYANLRHSFHRRRPPSGGSPVTHPGEPPEHTTRPHPRETAVTRPSLPIA